MPDKKRTERTEKHTSALDNEIKKALEYCSKQGITSECEKCKMPKNTCRTELIGYALDLINRKDAEIESLQAEIERLEKEAFTYKIRWAKSEVRESKAKAEAYKECVEKVKEKSKKTEVVCSGALVTMSYAISNKNLDNLLKELVGDA